MRKRSSLFFASFLCFAPFVSASLITYDVTVDTSSIAGTAGSLDFNFNPGPLVTQAADLQILNFTSNGTLSACAANVQGFCPTGDVTGTLPGTLTFDNGTGFNDYFDDFTFGTTISFDVSLYGPALSAPDGVSTSGSTFAFSMFSDAAGTVPALTTDLTDGWAFTVDVNLDGTTTVTNSSAQTDVGSGTSAVPEPSSLALMVTAIALLGTLRFRRRRPSRSTALMTFRFNEAQRTRDQTGPNKGGSPPLRGVKKQMSLGMSLAKYSQNLTLLRRCKTYQFRDVDSCLGETLIKLDDPIGD